MHDSFYTKAGSVLRTHTTAFQVRAMRYHKSPPIRAMTAGRCYRRDEIDATHFPIFNQLDVIAIDETISFADLKWTLDRLIRTCWDKMSSFSFGPAFSRSPRRSPRSTCFTAVDGWSCSVRA